MNNLYYRSYVIHEDIPSICYTILDHRPHRYELNRSSTLMEAMHWVDEEIVKQTVSKWVELDLALRQPTCGERPFQLTML